MWKLSNQCFKLLSIKGQKKVYINSIETLLMTGMVLAAVGKRKFSAEQWPTSGAISSANIIVN